MDFLGGSSVNDTERPLDIAFVEGSVASAARGSGAAAHPRARRRCWSPAARCACFGGVAAMDADRCRATQMAGDVYGAGRPAATTSARTGRSRDFVKVDVAIPGCPMEKDEFLRGGREPAERRSARAARVSGLPRVQDARAGLPAGLARDCRAPGR